VAGPIEAASGENRILGGLLADTDQEGIPARGRNDSRMANPTMAPKTSPVAVPAVAHDLHISEIFYFFEAHTSVETGREVGRKIGMLQEVMLKKYLEAVPDLKRRMYFERRLTGRSGASHKVEFSWFWITPHTGLSPRDELLDGLVITKVNESTRKVSLNAGWDRAVQLKVDAATPRTGRLHDFLEERKKDLRVVDICDGTASIDVVDHTRLLASLESKRVGAQRFKDSEKLGAGIQTIEKAKQASLVAIDLDLQHNHSIKPFEAPGASKDLLSFVVLGNGVHWTKKDLQILGTYADYTFTVCDDSVIRYLGYVKERVEPDNFLKGFMNYFVGMTKQSEDDFPVNDDDFKAMIPNGETRALHTILEEHLSRVNQI
jgi:hypothetical protein